MGRNVSELLRQVKAFQHVKATGGVTPSGWQPGPDQVGKVWRVWKPGAAYN
jgi:peroxiredoxin (alkyl hydroperoxide reductase subunit C)